MLGIWISTFGYFIPCDFVVGKKNYLGSISILFMNIMLMIIIITNAGVAFPYIKSIHATDTNLLHKSQFGFCF